MVSSESNFNLSNSSTLDSSILEVNMLEFLFDSYANTSLDIEFDFDLNVTRTESFVEDDRFAEISLSTKFIVSPYHLYKGLSKLSVTEELTSS